MDASDLDLMCINTLRFLSVDAVQKANSGHPGLPLGAAPMAYTLWDRFLRFDPRHPEWPNRDRFVLSAGHGSALLYSLLHLFGYDLPVEQLKNFRQWDSATPGHPEFGIAPGIEATTGPLGQGFGNAVGMAIAEAALAARFNRPEFPIVDHHTYVLASDGDLMEGISSEAGSLAGHLGLGKLIVLYDNNHISIEGSTDLAFTEDRRARFAAFKWHTQEVDDGNDLEAVAEAIKNAREETSRPSFIQIRTHIGYGSPNKQDTADAHGSPLGEDEVRLTKEKLGWPVEPTFHVPGEAKAHFEKAAARGSQHRQEWEERFAAYAKKHGDLAEEFRRVIDRRLADGWSAKLPAFRPEDGPLATRKASAKVINGIAAAVPELMGGSADLAPSNNTLINESASFSVSDRAGRNLHFGVREHSMGAILNGMALHGGLIPYGATFLVFSDYMRPPMRLAAMSDLHVIYVFTHDSIGLGEDGPTHQPVEQLLGLRSVPNLMVLRPADANETTQAWRLAVESEQPVALVLTRQKLPVLDPDKYPQIAEGVARGGYILTDPDDEATPEIILTATGSEVHLALAAREALAEEGVQARVVSIPSHEVFQRQPEDYRQRVFPAEVPVLAIEAGRSLGWTPYLGRAAEVIGIDRFGASALGGTVMSEYGFNETNVLDRAKEVLRKHVSREGVGS